MAQTCRRSYWNMSHAAIGGGSETRLDSWHKALEGPASSTLGGSRWGRLLRTACALDLYGADW